MILTRFINDHNDLLLFIYRFLNIHEIKDLETCLSRIKKTPPLLLPFIVSISRNSTYPFYFVFGNDIHEFIDYELWKCHVLLVFKSIVNHKIKKFSFTSFNDVYSIFLGIHDYFHRIKQTDIQQVNHQTLTIKITNLVKWWSIYDSLQVNDRIDAMDYLGVWYECIVVEKHPIRGLLVQYIGWNYSWNEWYPYNKRFYIAALHTFTPLWRNTIRKGQMIEYQIDNMWYETICIERNDKSIRLERLMDKRIINIADIYQEKNICPIGFHIYYYFSKNAKQTYLYRDKYCLYNLSLLPRNGIEVLYLTIDLSKNLVRLQEHVQELSRTR